MTIRVYKRKRNFMQRGKIAMKQNKIHGTKIHGNGKCSWGIGRQIPGISEMVMRRSAFFLDLRKIKKMYK